MEKSVNECSGCGCELYATKSEFQPSDADCRETDQSNRITGFIHCAQCIREFPQVLRQDGIMSYSDYQEIEVGYTDVGIQVRCKRHGRNILHLDFEGMSHPLAVTQVA
jgi:hypothetical protein